ncbi:hypothetical protein OA90_14570 [Labrenzia sp. OB1]|nr:hypothetical protein OA90_14570 [Labrenzia sp. OB1]
MWPRRSGTQDFAPGRAESPPRSSAFNPVQLQEVPMRLTAPSFIVFLISFVLFIIAVLPLAGIAIPSIGVSALWLLIAAYVILAAGVLFKGI